LLARGAVSDVATRWALLMGGQCFREACLSLSPRSLFGDRRRSDYMRKAALRRWSRKGTEANDVRGV
jgi:hypothetical protein